MPERRHQSEAIVNDMRPLPPEDFKLMVIPWLQGYHTVDFIRRVLEPADINLGPISLSSVRNDSAVVEISKASNALK